MAAGNAGPAGLPGAAVLGRGAVVADGRPGPPALAGAPRVRVDADVLADAAGAARVAALLREHWAGREPVVVELAVDPAALKQAETERRPPYLLDPGFAFPLEQLRFLVWANTYDCRGAEPIWWHGRIACRHPGVEPSAAADVRLVADDADGWVDAWVDGGPRVPLDLPVVHRESVEAGRPALARHAPPGGDLAPDQLAAVSHPGGPARIVAPAGSGKTRVLTARLRHLLADRGFEPQAVTAVAYNKRAAEEMVERTAGVGAQVRTLHSLGYEIARAAHGSLPVLDEPQVRDLVAELAPVRPKPNADVYAPYLEALAAVRLGLRPPERVEAERDDVPGFAGFFDAYRQRLRGRGVIDHDEQIYGALEALLGDPVLRERFQRRCRHLLVDEFQDLTPAFLLMIRLLSAPAWQVFGVGDDDQTIYGYAGATPDWLLDYARYFPHAASHALEVNYRCPPAVVDAATTLLAHNTRRVAKTIRAGRPGPADDDALTVRRADLERLAHVAVERIQARLGAGAAPHDVAVLARVNAMLLPIQVALLAAGIPSTSPVGEEVLGRTGVATALAWLRCATNPSAMAGPDVAEAVRRSPHKVPGRVLRRLAGGSAWPTGGLRRFAARTIKGWEGRLLQEWVDDLEVVVRAARVSSLAALEAIRDTGLDEAMGDLDASGRDAKRSASHLDDLDALVQVAALHPQAATFEDWLRATLSAARPRGGRRGRVQLETVHRAKGCEFDHVVVFAANDELMPHRLAGPALAEQEEERRIFHVALTRCRVSVDVVADAAAPSPYLAELVELPSPARSGARSA